MIDRSHALPVSRQAQELGISRGSVTAQLGCRSRDMAYTAVLHREKVAISMDGRGAWRDHGFVEPAALQRKCEEVHLWACGSVTEARTSIGRYLTFYNERRPHSSRDRRTPDHVYSNRPLLAAA